MQSHIFPLLREKVHLQEAAIGLSLYLDEIRDRKLGANLREVRSFSASPVHFLIHILLLVGAGEKAVGLLLPAYFRWRGDTVDRWRVRQAIHCSKGY
ncbi:MAG: hypothetical protein A3G20_09290 [Acidobacteria bacterium RIFCSPLOWO2_12_FULL_59_11]|nr:MAG: hypothetical protein A3G20_09290 [Acidobacteria bacterium RIFCSPLOWO2_12_FULL_59_11]